MTRRKEINGITFEVLDGFSGTGAIDDASISASDTTLGIDTLSLNHSATIVPVGARFSTAGINTVRTVSATQNSQQWTATITGSPTGGDFTLTLNGEETAAIAYNAAATAVQSAIEALASMTSGDVTVSGSAGGPYTITLAGSTFGNTSGNTLTADGSGLTGGTSPDVTIASVQDGTTTWEVTFTPAIASGSVPSDDDVITFYPRKVEVKVGEGDIGHSKTKDTQIDRDRGTIDGGRDGDEQAMTVDFAFVYDWLRSTTTDAPTVDEALEREGEAADWTNAARDDCEPYQVTLKLIDAPNCGSEQAEIILYKYFIAQDVSASVRDAAVTVSGICLTPKPVKYRVTNATYNIEITNS